MSGLDVRPGAPLAAAQCRAPGVVEVAGERVWDLPDRARTRHRLSRYEMQRLTRDMYPAST